MASTLDIARAISNGRRFAEPVVLVNEEETGVIRVGLSEGEEVVGILGHEDEVVFHRVGKVDRVPSAKGTRIHRRDDPMGKGRCSENVPEHFIKGTIIEV